MLTSIRARLSILILLVSAPALGLNLYFAWARRQSGEEEALAQASRMAKIATENQREELEGGRQLLITIAKISRIRSGDYKRGERLLQELLDDASNQYYNLFVLDRMGQIVCDARHPIYRQDKRENPQRPIYDHYTLFNKVMINNDLTIRKYPMGFDNAKTGIVLAYPLRDFYGKLAGAVAAVVDLEWLQTTKSEIGLPSDAFLTVVDAKGDIFSAGDRQGDYKKILPDRRKVEYHILNNHSLFEETGRDGTRRVFALSPVIKASNKLFWCVGIPAQSLYSPVNQIYFSSLAVLAFSAFMVLAAAWGISTRTIVQPLNALLRGTRGLAKGQLKQRVGQTSGMLTELAELATSFDRMAHAIEMREEALEKSRKRLADILSIVHEAIISLDENQSIRFFNASAQRMFAFTQEDVLGRSLLALFHHKHHGELKSFLADFSHHENFSEVYVGDLCCIRKNGTEFYAELSVSKLQIGQETLYTAMIRDITVQKKTAEQQARWQAELVRSNSELEQFAYNVSHDLQEPLRMVASYTRLLQHEYAQQLDQRGQDFITFASESAVRLQRMIHDLLTYARAGRPGLRLTTVSCQALVAQILADLQRLVEASEATIIYEGLPDIVANETELRQLFQNLLVNALKFRSNEPPRIVIKSQELDDGWDFIVQDNGIGLDPKFSERIFGLFQRLHPHDAFEGTGIGLAICRKIVENLGGRIWVESTPGNGATFRFTLKTKSIVFDGEMTREAVAH